MLMLRTGRTGSRHKPSLGFGTLEISMIAEQNKMVQVAGVRCFKAGVLNIVGR